MEIATAKSMMPDDEAEIPAGLLDGQLIYLLARAAAQASAPMHQKIRQHGLSVPEWRTLMTIADAPRTISALADLLFMKQPTMTRLIARLELAGFVSRAPSGNDGRKVLVTLTVKGKQLTDEMIPIAMAHDADLLVDYSAEEAATLKQALRVLIKRTSSP